MLSALIAYRRPRRNIDNVIAVPTLLILTIVCLFFKQTLSLKIPVVYNIPKYGEECFFETLNKQEQVTISLFVLEGKKLEVSTTFGGPIAPIDVKESELLTSFMRKNYMQRRKSTAWSETVDMMAKMDQKIYDDDDFWDDDEGMGIKSREKKESRVEELVTERKKREIGDAFEKTIKVKEDGWYRVCLSGPGKIPIAVEVEIRKSSDFGMSPKTGHVLTHDQHAALEFEKKVFSGAAKKQDLQRPKLQLNSIKRLVDRIRSLQQEERHQRDIHKKMNESSQDKMKSGAILETFIMICLTVFQIVTIKSWFKNQPILGY